MSSRALRKLQNDQELLDSLIGSSNDDNNKSEKAQKDQSTQNTNIFAVMNEFDQREDENDEFETSDPKPQISRRSQKANNNDKKRSKKNRKKAKGSLGNDEAELEDMIRLYKEQDLLKYGADDLPFTKDEGKNGISLESFAYVCQFYDLKCDSGFTQFPPSCLKCCVSFFNNDLKKLDPDFEFKLLFDDISSESLKDIESMSSTHISPQQLKEIQRLKRFVRNWGGKDCRTVPSGAGPGGAAHRLQFTKIQEDWLPTPRGELSMQSVELGELCEWQIWQRPSDLKHVIENDVNNWRKNVSFYKFEPLDPAVTKKAMTEFYVSVILRPDHENLIHLISSKFPYHVPPILQVALIAARQGDRSNTNALIQRALFVFDRALRYGIKFDSVSCQLPYTFFFNRQFYLAIFRYILLLAQRGAVSTASEWCKTLWSLSPLEDPLGCRYFIDYYLLLNKEYDYLIELSKSPLVTCYKQWYTLGISLGIALSHLYRGNYRYAHKELVRAFKYHTNSLATLFVEKLEGDQRLTKGLEFQVEANVTEVLEARAYATRFHILWKNPEYLNFLKTELTTLFKDLQINLEERITSCQEETVSPFFIEGIPINLVRFSLLSEESSVMAAIPTSIWSNHEVYEFDILPPLPTTRGSKEFIENIRTFVDDRELARSQRIMDHDEGLLNQIRQLSLEQFLQENPNVIPE